MTPIGSRRMNEVWSFMYSPAAMPSRWRAAPAKKRIWSTESMISSSTRVARGLPVSCDSRSANSSARASIASAMRNRASCRSAGVVSPQSSKASAAAAKAASTSAAPETGDVA